MPSQIIATKGLSAILALGAAPQSTEAPPPPLLAPVRSALSGDDPVGARRSGAICTPAGKLLWRDVAADGADLAVGAATALRDAGIAVTAPDPEALAPSATPALPQIVATIERVAMRSCTPWHGLKLAAAVRVSGRLAVTWRLYDAHGGSPLRKLTSCRNFKIDDAPTLRAAFGRAFAASAATDVPALVATGGPMSAGTPCVPEERSAR